MRAREVDARVGGERVQRRLRRVVGRPERRERHAAENRRDVDDLAAAARDEMRRDRLHAVQRRLHVHGHHQVELLVGELEHRPGDAAAGVVDPDVDVAERLDRAIAQALDVAPPRDVGRHRDRAPAGTAGDLLQLALAPRGQRDPMSRGAELHGERRADAAARAGDDDVLHRRFYWRAVTSMVPSVCLRSAIVAGSPFAFVTCSGLGTFTNAR